MDKKIRVGILFGGKSGEHEVSLQSAKNVFEAIDKDKYDVVLLGIDKQGQWSLLDTSQFLLNAEDPRKIKLRDSHDHVSLVPGNRDERLVNPGGHKSVGPIDVIFPILHGPFGEDGTVQGLLKLANLPFVGAGVLGSAVGMDKDVMKRLLRDAKIPIGRFQVFHRQSGEEMNFKDIKAELGLPFFIKPANYGSSIGINKVRDLDQFERAFKEAFEFDNKIVIEENIEGREIECSVLGNEEPIASVPGEIIPRHDFYSYEAKYIDENGAYLKIPAELPSPLVSQIQDLATKTYQTLCCEGMARVDFFLKENNEIIVNELNTIPGFTKISMYPMLWEVSGISYTELIDRLIQLALDRFEKESRLKTSYES
ncbi:MAG: D-alanine--D-alanine ligase [Deltaproteobacteria bacterium]|nr:D-alanine--D-alanine ligase [Deltaproteobacteria bacterium]MBW2052688.1 D-alanine--D-alanine ligase [Deltaproteobacteria bacterium]MBW2140980.1 D-alanine--D-alanine ligase [Deltaproteobacteria bacterium]MBW2323149.1 D-alanine--D-alanine ligase [Deltaproteobacteria bacterium]